MGHGFGYTALALDDAALALGKLGLQRRTGLIIQRRGDERAHQ